jgi:spore germination protein GerM
MRRIVIILATLGLVACGTTTGAPEPTEQGSTTTVAPPTTVTSESTTTSLAPVETSTTQAPATTTTTTASVTTTSVSATTTSQAATSMQVAPYFYVDEAGHPERSGPFVLPVAREVPATGAVARAALVQLFAGPTAAETQSVPAISTAIPSGVQLLGLTINEDVATIDLSSEFGATEDSATVAQRAAQVVFTLSRFDSVAEVVFNQDGKPVSIQIGDGSLVSRPVGIWDYLEFAAAITVETPVYGGPAGNPLRATGFGALFEATFQYALADDDGLILEEGIAMTNNGTGWGGFDFTIDYEVDERQVGALIVWANSAKDGSQIDVREYPVVLRP